MVQSFASPEEIARWRAFGLIDGWEVAGTCDTEEGEIRLFDAPIMDGFFAPSIRIQEVACSRIIPGTLDGKEASEEIVRIRKGRLLATDSRFIAYNEVDHSAIFIWFDKIINVEYKNGDYLLTIDHHATIKERVFARQAASAVRYERRRVLSQPDNANFSRGVFTRTDIRFDSHQIPASRVTRHRRHPRCQIQYGTVLVRQYGSAKKSDRRKFCFCFLLLSERNSGQESFCATLTARRRRKKCKTWKRSKPL